MSAFSEFIGAIVFCFPLGMVQGWNEKVFHLVVAGTMLVMFVLYIARPGIIVDSLSGYTWQENLAAVFGSIFGIWFGEYTTIKILDYFFPIST